MWKIGFSQVVIVRPDIKGMAGGFGSAVNGKMLGSSYQFQVFGVIALQAFDKRDCHSGSEVRIFTVSFHASAPTRIAKDINIGCPESQSLINSPFVPPRVIVVFSPCFVRNGICYIEHHCIVPHGSHPDSLRKNRSQTRTCHAVQTFVPPVVGGNAQPVDFRRIIAHQLHFFFQRKFRNQIVGAFFKTQGCILIGFCPLY